jgi:hypothetical protein
VAEKPKHKLLSLGIDVLSAIFFCLLLFVFPILAHYFPNGRDADGNMTLVMKVLLADSPLAFIGAMWLIFRYAPAIGRRYPGTVTQGFKVRFVFVSLVLYLTGYLIIKNTLFKWIP